MKITSETLEGFCRDVLMVLGACEERAQIVSECMVKANLRGIDSHGIRRLPVYVKRIERGLIHPDGPIAVASQRGATTILDGGLAFGEVVGRHACDIVVQTAQQHGTGIAVCRNTNHFGMAACYGLYLSEKNMIGIVSSNANPSIAPWGGKQPLFGTNPLCITIPAGKRPSIVLDMAMSIVARGKIREAEEKGETIPDMWALGPDGTPTVDPWAALQGSLLPMGGPKGYCMALILDILSGMLSSAHCSTGIRSMFDMSGTSGMGHFFQAIDVASFLPVEEFTEKVDEYIENVKTSPRKEGTSELYVPGELEHLSAVKRKKEGIPLPEEVVKNLKSLEKTYLGTDRIFTE